MELDTLPAVIYSEPSALSKRQWQRAAALLMMLMAIASVYWPQVAALWSKPIAVADNAFVYQTDLDYWTQTSRARRVTAVAPFDLAHDLHDVPLMVGDWKGVDRQETNQEVITLLDPEQYVLRLYQNSKGQYIWLSMIGARSSQAFHPPDVCYDADGWQWDMNSHATQLADGSEIYGLTLDAHKEVADQPKPLEHVVYYFYLFPNGQNDLSSRNLADGIVLFKLTSSRYGTLEETLALQADFVRQFFLSAQG